MPRALGRWGVVAALGLSAGLAISGGRGSWPGVPRFGELPVLHEGRVKPLESVARATLLLLRGKQAIYDGRRAVAPAEWLLDALARPERADGYKVFRVDDPELLAAVGVAEPEGRYYSFRQLSAGLPALERLAREAESFGPGERTRVQAAGLNLYGRVIALRRLENTFRPASADAFAPMAAAPLAPGRPGFQERLSLYSFLAESAAFRPLPPLVAGQPDDWKSIGQALLDSHAGEPHPGVAVLAEMGDAWRRQDEAAFKSALDAHAAGVSGMPSARRARWEALFHRGQPFTVGMAFYLLAALLVLASWLAESKRLERWGYACLAGAVAVQSAGIFYRMWLEGRPPVTNLYSSAVSVGWVAGLVGVWQERRAGGGLAALAASTLGFCTLIIAQHLATQGDTMEMMRAVLDSNFWLATHVVTITVGYGAAFLAGTLAQLYLLRGVLTRGLDKETAGRLVAMTYFAIRLSLFFSFLGTVLGGIWADQSWGRFWGWDPKENGALLIVLWLAIILHCRWGGFVRERGLMVMAVFANIVTAFSWFGVNMLGIGLHSYGFMESAAFWLGAFTVLELAVMALGAVPRERWRSAAWSA